MLPPRGVFLILPTSGLVKTGPLALGGHGKSKDHLGARGTWKQAGGLSAEGSPWLGAVNQGWALLDASCFYSVGLSVRGMGRSVASVLVCTTLLAA